ncbi:tyrosine--tRNA ligase [Candidatus Parcubacteria bacterium]|nr:MAG: tyrosine--tRNA ligase [Candidatus Parcubacteria bacterium]
MDKQEKIQEVLRRGVENIYPSPEALEEVLRSGKKLKIYNGIDPTGPTLHLGHSVQMLKLKQLQDLGHEIIVLIGDFTAQIGDPTDKSLSARKQLTHKQVLQNAKDYRKQVGKILDLKKTKFKYNSKWLGKLSFADTLKLSSYFTAQQTLARDMFKKRMQDGKDLFLHEFLYPMMQAYDSVAMDVDLEIGGNDQMFNMLAGRTLMKKMKNKEKFVLTTKLLADPSGKKMGKTEGNLIGLEETPNNMYGKIMSWPDELINIGFEILTDAPTAEIIQIKKDLDVGQNPKIKKMLLAYKIVEMYHGARRAISAEENFKQVFQEGLNPDNIPEMKVESKNLIDILVETKLASSRADARRLVSQGGIKVDTKLTDDINYVVENFDADGVVIQKGKRFFVKIFKK